MKYLLTIYNDESGLAEASPADVEGVMGAYEAFSREAAAAGVLLGGEGLEPTHTATTVRVRDNQTLTTDGPFAETREQLGGYYVVECVDLDEAIGWAARIPGAGSGSVEVRPVMNYEGMGAERPDAAREASQT